MLALGVQADAATSALWFAEGMPAGETEEGNGEERGWDEVARGLAADLRRRIAVRWQELRAAETILGEAREEFGGEEVLQPCVWQELEEAKESLKELAQDMERYGRLGRWSFLSPRRSR